MGIFFNFIIFIIGISIGSFLNVIIYRIHEGLSWVHGRSFCVWCKKKLKWTDLFPVVSYLFLKGKCKQCNKKIPVNYLLVELLTGILFVLIFSSFFSIDFLGVLYTLFYLYVTSVLIVITVYDIKYLLIPDCVVLPAIIIIALLNIFVFGTGDILMNLQTYGFGAVLLGGFFLLQFIMTRGKGIGGGDLRLGVFMGVLLGWKVGIVTLFFAYIIGASFAIIGLLLGKLTFKSKMPLGPFLALATFLFMVYDTYIEHLLYTILTHMF